MYCRKCGAQNQDTAKFCKNCGNPLQVQEIKNVTESVQPKQKGKSVYFVIGATILLIAVVVAIIIGMKAKKTKEYESYLDTANKYIAELDYEQAQDYYLKAIAVAPKKLEPYVKLAEVYMDLGETEAAEQILEKAEEQGAKGEEEEIEILKESIITNILSYRLYAEKIYEYEEKYGVAEEKRRNDWYTYLTGLCFMKLVDFDQNGQEELLLVYGEEPEEDGFYSPLYRFEIWGVENDTMLLLDFGEDAYIADAGMTHVYLSEYEGNTYLVTGMAGDVGYFYYHGYADGKFSIVHSEEWDWMYYDRNGLGNCIDGKYMSESEFKKVHEKWFGNVSEYYLSYGDLSKAVEQNEETKHRLYPYYHTGELKKEETKALTPDEIHEKLVAHYAKGTEDCPGEEMTVMPGEIYEGNSYEATVRCGVSGNPSATQMLYEIIVDVKTGEVTQIRRLTDDKVVTFNLYDE